MIWKIIRTLCLTPLLESWVTWGARWGDTITPRSLAIHNSDLRDIRVYTNCFEICGVSRIISLVSTKSNLLLLCLVQILSPHTACTHGSLSNLSCDPHIRFNFISPQICSVFGINSEELSTLQDQGLETKPKRYEASVDRYQVIMIFRLVGKRPFLHCWSDPLGLFFNFL